MTTRNTSILAPETTGISECVQRLTTSTREARPLSTYRFQFHAGFRLQDATRLVPYLHALGVTHCYSSPILKARTGSTHGYDISNHNALNPEIGDEDDLRRLSAELNSRKMGLVLDIVPNHMGVGQGDNPWWQDVLENGRSSEYADFFDIDWNPVKTELADKVLIPVLGDQYGAELEAGRIRLQYGDGRFFITYFDQLLPIDPQTAPMIFEPIGDLRAYQGVNPLSDSERSELENILWDLRQMPPHKTGDPDRAQLRRKQIPDLKRRLCELADRSTAIRELIDAAVAICNGDPGNPRSFDALHRLLEAQPYRLAHWRVSAQEINYRRFFDINDLVGLRMENPQVFAATHHLIRRLLAEGIVNGLRLDHPDGLLNPVQYFTRVQMLYAASQCCGATPVAATGENGIEIAVQDSFGQHDWANERPPLYLLVEKILERGEDLPREWPVDGTVGYDFANLVNGVFIDQRSERFFTNLYRRFIGGPLDLELLIYEAKKLIMRTALSSEVTVLSRLLEEIASTDRYARDFTRPALTDAIREVIACFPVYRSYVDERGNVSERDRDYIVEAIKLARRRNPGTSGGVFDFLRGTLLLESGHDLTSDVRRRQLHFTLKFQQLTGPVMAKGLEDTVCYVYNRFISVNEVGGSPAEFGLSVEEFHSANRKRAESWPHSMLATSTHDTKHSEDVRARLNVLSEMPRTWAAQVMRWRRMNRARRRTIGDGRMVPDPNEEYLLYQTLVGAWPLPPVSPGDRNSFAQRIKSYMTKAVHEAKVNLSWVNQNPEYVQALEQFIDRILYPGSHARPNHFLTQIEAFVPIVAFFGAVNSAAQVLLKIAAPGVPDIYRGTEIWDFSLVDPDNRRPIDYEVRQGLLDGLLSQKEDRAGMPALCRELVRNYHDGRLKLWTTLCALNFRRDRSDLFAEGDYLPLYANGEAQEHVLAFARTHGQNTAIAAAPRLSYTLMKGQTGAPIGEVWGNTELVIPHASADLLNIFTGQILRSSDKRTLLCREIFADFPVALLTVA